MRLRAPLVPLARAGYRVVGVDRSEALLAEARRRAGGERRPKFVAADYRELPFAGRPSTPRVNLFTSLGYLGDEEDVRVLAEIRRVLRPGGRLVIETMHRDLLVRDVRDQVWQVLGAGRLLLEQRTFDAAAGVAQTTQTIDRGPGARESRTYSRARLRGHRARRDARPRGLRRGPLPRRLRRRAVHARPPGS